MLLKNVTGYHLEGKGVFSVFFLSHRIDEGKIKLAVIFNEALREVQFR
jgi:hypothetical protein